METKDLFEGKVLLVTGGTGSFGNTVVQRFLKTNIKEIRIFSRDEKKQDDMRKKYGNEKLKFFIGDVRDQASIVPAMKGVDYVFHAAALKQVPSCEFFPIEAVKTNILGTNNVLQTAIQCGVKRVVCLSTDKAAYPINAMGISKAMMEKVIVANARNQHDTVICCTRYGNVMCSRGSVIPLFIDQIRQGKELTITEPKMTRFLMNLDEAVELVLYAFQNGKPGDLFVQKADASTIGDLAQAVSEMFGGNGKYRTIGIRHGEKMYETLLTKEEAFKAIDMGDYYRVPMDARDLNYELYEVNGSDVKTHLGEFNSDNTKRLDVEGIKEKLLTTSYVKNALKGIFNEY